MRGRTSIVVAHRLSTVAVLDRVVVLENGAIVEDGTRGRAGAGGRKLRVVRGPPTSAKPRASHHASAPKIGPWQRTHVALWVRSLLP